MLSHYRPPPTVGDSEARSFLPPDEISVFVDPEQHLYQVVQMLFRDHEQRSTEAAEGS